MKIWMIWARENHDGHLWLVDAWDDDTTAENYGGWEEAVEKARSDLGSGGEIRVVTGTVDFDAVRKSFETPDVGALS